MIKFYLLRFCIRNNITQTNLGVDSSRELSQEIGYKIKNKFRDVEKLNKSYGVAYRGLSLIIDDVEDFEYDELREKVKTFENIVF